MRFVILVSFLLLSTLAIAGWARNIPASEESPTAVAGMPDSIPRSIFEQAIGLAFTDDMNWTWIALFECSHPDVDWGLKVSDSHTGIWYFYDSNSVLVSEWDKRADGPKRIALSESCDSLVVLAQ